MSTPTRLRGSDALVIGATGRRPREGVEDDACRKRGGVVRGRKREMVRDTRVDALREVLKVTVANGTPATHPRGSDPFLLNRR
jgi:hypothetical protein